MVVEMSSCKFLARSSLSFLKCSFPATSPSLLPLPQAHPPVTRLFSQTITSSRKCFTSSALGAAASVQPIDFSDETLSKIPIFDSPEDQSKDTVQQLLANTDDVARLMKMERKPLLSDEVEKPNNVPTRWFPYIEKFRCGDTYVSSGEILEAVSRVLWM